MFCRSIVMCVIRMENIMIVSVTEVQTTVVQYYTNNFTVKMIIGNTRHTVH